MASVNIKAFKKKVCETKESNQNTAKCGFLVFDRKDIANSLDYGKTFATNPTGMIQFSNQ